MTRPLVASRAALQHGRDLDRVVAVVVEDLDAVPRAGMGEAPLDAAEATTARADRLRADAELVRDRDGRGGVGDVVPAGHRQAQAFDHSRATPVLRSRMTTSKVETAPSMRWLVKRTSACGFSP